MPGVLDFSLYISMLRWYGTDNFTRYWYVVRTFLARKKGYGTGSTTIRFDLILSQRYITLVWYDFIPRYVECKF